MVVNEIASGNPSKKRLLSLASEVLFCQFRLADVLHNLARCGTRFSILRPAFLHELLELLGNVGRNKVTLARHVKVVHFCIAPPLEWSLSKCGNLKQRHSIGENVTCLCVP